MKKSTSAAAIMQREYSFTAKPIDAEFVRYCKEDAGKLLLF